MAIVLGGHTFTRGPGSMTSLTKDRDNAYVKTYSSVAHFSWGPTIIGKEIDMTWNAMNADEFTILQGLYEADAPVVLVPNDGLGISYNVQMLSLNSTYYKGRTTGASSLRIDIELKLLILSQV